MIRRGCAGLFQFGFVEDSNDNVERYVGRPKPINPPPWAVLPARPSDNAYVRCLGALLCRTVDPLTACA